MTFYCPLADSEEGRDFRDRKVFMRTKSNHCALLGRQTLHRVQQTRLRYGPTLGARCEVRALGNLASHDFGPPPTNVRQGFAHHNFASEGESALVVGPVPVDVNLYQRLLRQVLGELPILDDEIGDSAQAEAPSLEEGREVFVAAIILGPTHSTSDRRRG
jgi:hypothetical protein